MRTRNAQTSRRVVLTVCIWLFCYYPPKAFAAFLLYPNHEPHHYPPLSLVSPPTRPLSSRAIPTRNLKRIQQKSTAFSHYPGHISSSSSRLYQATSSSELKKKKNQRQAREKNTLPTSAASTVPPKSKKRTRKVSNNAVHNKPKAKSAATTSPSTSTTTPSVVSRLSQAAKRANAKKKKREAELQNNSKVHTNVEDESVIKHEPLAGLQQLTHAIDERLRASQNSPEHRDSMTSVVRHNVDNQKGSVSASTRSYYTFTTQQPPEDTSNHTVSTQRPPDREVAIVLAKPLQHDCITLEYANRIRRLVRAMMIPTNNNMEEEEEEEETLLEDDDDDPYSSSYRPDVICFVGPQSPGNILVDADVGYLYFLYLCQAHSVDIAGIDIHLVKGSVAEGALQQIAFFLQETCLPAWLRSVSQQQQPEPTANKVTSSSTTSSKSSSSSSSFSQQLQPQPNPQSNRNHLLRVHFSLISSEYELCQLNDIHIRSPGQSVLRALESWSQRSFSTTWSYLYVTTVTQSADPAQAFLSKTYKTAQQLLPVIQNLRNVVRNREFFQTESYRVLVAARRSLVSDMESLYEQQPQLKAVHHWRSPEHWAPSEKDGSGPSSSSRPVDVVLEGALLLLGRCVDIVRPAGLLTGSPVSQDDWKLALVLLKQAFEAITTACDPDRPLEPHEWIGLGDDDEESGCE